MSEASNSALTDALEIQKRAAAVGFDWPDESGPRDKITEELAELDRSIRHSSVKSVPAKAGDRNPGEQSSSHANVVEELGDLLFAVVNLARHLRINPESALADANAKFQRRFHYIEERLSAEGLHPGEVDLARLDALWNEAKRHESDP